MRVTGLVSILAFHRWNFFHKFVRKICFLPI